MSTNIHDNFLKAHAEFTALCVKYPTFHFIGNCKIKVKENVSEFIENKTNMIMIKNTISNKNS